MGLIMLSLFLSCQNKEKDWECRCTDSNGLVSSTTIHATEDMAYQECRQIQENSNNAECHNIELK